MSSQEQKTTMPILIGYHPDEGGFATDAKETCECEKNDKDFSQEDLGSKVDDSEFHDSTTDGKNKRLHVDRSGMPLCCLYCSRWVVDPRNHYIPDAKNDSHPTQIPRCQNENYTPSMCNRCTYPELPGSDHTDASDRLCNPSCYADGTNHLLDEEWNHVDRNGLPVMCGICENWIRHCENHGKRSFPDDDVPLSPQFCLPDNSERENITCHKCKFPKIGGSVHYTDPTRQCDPSCYADGTKHLLDQTGHQIECPGCSQLIRDPRKHNYVPYLDTYERVWSCREFPESMMSSASGGFQLDPM